MDPTQLQDPAGCLNLYQLIQQLQATDNATDPALVTTFNLDLSTGNGWGSAFKPIDTNPQTTPIRANIFLTKGTNYLVFQAMSKGDLFTKPTDPITNGNAIFLISIFLNKPAAPLGRSCRLVPLSRHLPISNRLQVRQRNRVLFIPRTSECKSAGFSNPQCNTYACRVQRRQRRIASMNSPISV